MSGGPRGTEPLDLRAVEARLQAAINGVEYAGAVDDVTALLALARALRAALQEVHEANMTASNWLNFEYRDTPVAQRVAAVLGAAQDGP